MSIDEGGAAPVVCSALNPMLMPPVRRQGCYRLLSRNRQVGREEPTRARADREHNPAEPCTLLCMVRTP